MLIGLIVESKILPETEKSICYELFLPIKQLRALVDQQHSESSVYDSLGRKLKRLKCIDRELGLYPDLSNYLPASFLEQLCDLVLRSIETVIIPTKNQSNGNGQNVNQKDGNNGARRRSYDVRIRMKSS